MYKKNLANEEIIQRVYKDPAEYYDLHTVLDGIFNQTTASIYMIKKLLHTVNQLNKNKRLIVTIADLLLISLCYLKQNPQPLFTPENTIKEKTGIRFLQQEDVYKNTIRITIKKDGSLFIVGKNKQQPVSIANINQLEKAIDPFVKLLNLEKSRDNNGGKTEAMIKYDGNEVKASLPDNLIIKLRNSGLKNVERVPDMHNN